MVNQGTARQTMPDTSAQPYRQAGDTNADCHRVTGATRHIPHIPVVMHEDVTRFYGRLSSQGRHVLARMLLGAPSLERPFRVVVSSLARVVGCSKLSVLRNLPKGEKVGLFQRETDPRGSRHGSIITPFRERCEIFLALHRRQYALLPEPDTNDDRFQAQGDTGPDRYQAAAIGISPDDPVAMLAASLSEPSGRFFHELFRQAASSPTLTLSVQRLARDVHASETTARRSLARGQAAGLFTRNRHHRGPRHGTVLAFHATECRRFMQLMPVQRPGGACEPDTRREWYQKPGVTSPEQYQGQGVTNGDRYHDTNGAQYAESQFNQRQSLPSGDSTPQPDTGRDRYRHPLLDRRNKNLSVLPEGMPEDPMEERVARHLVGIGQDEFQIVWPRLDGEGFGPSQIRQLVRHRLALGLTVRDLENSLHAAEFELVQETFPETRKGICNYVFGTLKIQGTWRRTPGFEAPEERALRLAQEADNKRRELEKIQDDARENKGRKNQEEAFDLWMQRLTPEERDRIAAKAPVHISSEIGRRQWFKTYWTRNREVA